MTKTTLSLALLLLSIGARGQGTVLFDNHVPGIVEARFLFDDGATGYGAGWTTQLYGGPEGASLLLPLFPTTTFKSSTTGEMGYVNPVLVTVRGVRVGARATLEMRAFPDADPRCVVRTAPITVVLGGDALPPAHLVGLEGVTGYCILEPSTLLLGILGAGLLWFSRGQRLR